MMGTNWMLTGRVAAWVTVGLRALRVVREQRYSGRGDVPETRG